MINSETPYKLAEIIRNTWPQLYRAPKLSYDSEKISNHEQILDSKRKINKYNPH